MLTRFAVCLIAALTLFFALASSAPSADPTSPTPPDPADSAADFSLRPIPPPEDLPAAPWTPHDVASVAAGILLLSAAVVIALVRLRHARRQSADQPPGAHALAELRRLASLNLVESGNAAEFYRRVSAVVRRYADDRFGLRATRQTTDELLADPRTCEVLPPDERRRLTEFFRDCDPVKYGPVRPGPDGARALVALACRFVDATQDEHASSTHP